MRAEQSHSAPRRTASRKLSNDEEVDLRRARGEISCAECRSSNAIKNFHAVHVSAGAVRLFAQMGVYPLVKEQGDLTMPGLITDLLHAKMSEMGQRIRQLEDALAIFQSGVSTEVHPLLREELLSIKFGPEKGYNPDGNQAPQRTSVESTIDALGTLTIGDRGEGKYFGPSAGSEALFLAGADLYPNPEDDIPVSIEMARLSVSFPFGVDGNVENAFDILLDHLPSQPRAWSLCETYMEHAAWSFRPVKRDEIVDDILSPTYKALKERKTSRNSGAHTISSHKLAVLFLVFALGALVDLTLEPYNQEAEMYYQLSRASLSLRSIFDSPEIATVQAVVLMAAYHGMAGKRYTMDSSWTLSSLGSKLAQSIGLHRDCARWNMDSKTVQRRRSLFWEILSAELFYSLALGRPPSVRLSYVDCEFPEDDEATLDENGNVLVGYYQWKYAFTRDILTPLIELTLTAKAPQYQTILDLDKKVREKTLPPHLNVFMSSEDEHCTPSVYMQRCLLGQYRSITLLYIHRCFFAQAMLDHPVNPLRSPYSPSFLAAYRCASGIIKSCLNHFDRFPELSGRWWSIWTHLFSAAVIVGCIVTRSPSSSMASSAFIELGLACDLFERGAAHSRRARSGLAILYKLRDRAFHVYSQFRSGNSSPVGVLSIGNPDYGDDELALFGGQTRVLVSKLLSSNGCLKRKSSSPSGSGPTSPSPDSTSFSSDVHPSLVEYLSMFSPSNPSVDSPTLATARSANIHSTNIRDKQGQASTNFTQEPIPHGSFGHSNRWPTWALPSSNIHPSNTYSAYQPEAQNTSALTGQLDSTNTPQKSNTDDLTDLGMMMTGESGMDQQWMSFMQDSGILDLNTYATSYTTVTPSMPPLDTTSIYQ